MTKSKMKKLKKKKEKKNQKKKKKKKNQKKKKEENNEEKEKSENNKIIENNKDITITDKVIINCEEGYYIPTDDKKKKKCRKCLDENCAQCKGSKKVDYCISCKESYYLLYNKKRR